MLGYDLPQEILKNVYWIGSPHKDQTFGLNSYVLVKENSCCFIDPGGMNLFSSTLRKVLYLSDLSSISHVILQRPTPDSGAMLSVLEEFGSEKEIDYKIVTHPFTRLYLPFYGLKREVYDLSENNYSLKTDELELQFIATPFLPSPGHFMSFYPDKKILFSGVLFSYLGQEEDFKLFDNDIDSKDYEAWHQQIVPHKKILKSVLDYLKSLDIEIIAPSYGSILKGKESIARLFYKLDKINYKLRDVLGD